MRNIDTRADGKSGQLGRSPETTAVKVKYLVVRVSSEVRIISLGNRLGLCIRGHRRVGRFINKTLQRTLHSPRSRPICSASPSAGLYKFVRGIPFIGLRRAGALRLRTPSHGWVLVACIPGFATIYL